MTTPPRTNKEITDRLDLLKERITESNHLLERRVWMEAYHNNLTLLATKLGTTRTLVHYIHYATWYATMTDVEDRLRLQTKVTPHGE